MGRIRDLKHVLLQFASAMPHVKIILGVVVGMTSLSEATVRSMSLWMMART